MRDTRKIVQALNYIACSQPGKTVNILKAYKLLWLADRYHLRQYGRTVSGDEYYALPHGPVPSDAMNIVSGKTTHLPSAYPGSEYIRKNHRYSIVSKKDPALEVFSASDMEALNLVLDKFGSKTWNELSDFSHTFPEWKAYEQFIQSPYSKNGYKIDMDLFFEASPDASGLFVDSPEQLAMTKEIFHESRL